MRFPRSSGILLPLASLPSQHGIGDLGPNSYQFADWLKKAGQRLWQILPFSIADEHGCPYTGFSSYGGNYLLISPEKLLEHGLLRKEDLLDLDDILDTRYIQYPKVEEYKRVLFNKAHDNFLKGRKYKKEFNTFIESEKEWLEDLALFQILTEQFGNSWVDWPIDYKYREKSALESLKKKCSEQFQFYQFLQFIFFKQWEEWKTYVNSLGIKIIGDIPIFLAHHSMDIWKSPHLFKLDNYGNPYVVTGAPPDNFSPVGQKWNNPNYNWWQMEQDGFLWWRKRLDYNLKYCDIIRLDHFRGFASTWEIDRDNPDARSGQWSWVPGDNLFHCFYYFRQGDLPLIVEDLGKITDDVIWLRDKYNLPGMKILQFAFSKGQENVNLPHNYPENCVVYTGTHDNQTSKGWAKSLGDTLERQYMLSYTGAWNLENINWTLIHLAANSRADMAIYPLQDVIGSSDEARINTPGTLKNNWAWRFQWTELTDYNTHQLSEITYHSYRNRFETF